MTEQEVRDAVRSHGWSFLPRTRRSKSYVYAARKVQGQRKEVYISPFANLAWLTSEQLVAKLTDVVTATSVGMVQGCSSALQVNKRHLVNQ